MSGYQRMLDRVVTSTIVDGIENKRKERARERVLAAFNVESPESLLDKMKGVRDKEAKALKRQADRMLKRATRKGRKPTSDEIEVARRAMEAAGVDKMSIDQAITEPLDGDELRSAADIKFKDRSLGFTQMMMDHAPVDELEQAMTCDSCRLPIMSKNAAWNCFIAMRGEKVGSDAFVKAGSPLMDHCRCAGVDYEAYERRFNEAKSEAVLEILAALGDSPVDPKPMPGDGYTAQKPEGFKGKKNVYTCPECGHQIVTVDREDGTTPFLTMCKADPSSCRGMMQSSFYRVDQDLVPSYEWYRPDDVSGETPAVKDHVSRGGLLLREIDD